MLRFIVYRYISYKDSKISHASLLTLRHHLSQLPPALLPTPALRPAHDLHTTYPSTRLSILDPPTLPMCTLLPIHSYAITCYTYYPAHTCHTPPRPAHLPHRCTMPPLYPIDSTTQPYYPPHCPTTYPSPTPPCSTTHLTASPPAHDLHHYSAIYPRSAYPTYVHTASYPLLRSHLLHVLSCTPHTRATLHTALPISPTDVPCPPISYSLYHTALPIAPLSSI